VKDEDENSLIKEKHRGVLHLELTEEDHTLDIYLTIHSLLLLLEVYLY
jgi:hypothetical protein